MCHLLQQCRDLIKIVLVILINYLNALENIHIAWLFYNGNKSLDKLTSIRYLIKWDQFLGLWWTIFRMKIVSCATTGEQKLLKSPLTLKKKWGRTHFYGYVLLNVSCCCRKRSNEFKCSVPESSKIGHVQH